MAALLDRITRDWLDRRRGDDVDDAAEQARLHAAAKRCFGTIRGENPRRAERARETIRERLAARRGRRS